MPHRKELSWLEEYERLAEAILGDQDTRTSKDIHPIVKAWYEETLNTDAFVPSTQLTLQALACLTTEVMTDMPDNIFHQLFFQVEEEEIIRWVQEILILGRTFEHALKTGQLRFDD